MHPSKGNYGGLPSAAVLAALTAMLAGFLSGCAAPGAGKRGDASGTGKKPGTEAVKVADSDAASDLAGLAKTKEDQLILDLLLGYRMLLLANPDAKTLDKGTLKRSRDAHDRLENILRHGGVKAQEDGERVYTITSQDKLSFQELLNSAGQAAAKAAQEGDWDKARARWKEILQSKAAMATAMEEAQWGVTLADALQSSLPDSLKRRLKNVNESYASEIGYEEIGKQVKALLEIVPEVKLQRELKKLANRAWERDKRAGRQPSQAGTSDADAGAGAAPEPGPAAAAGPAHSDSNNSAIGAQADSLAAQGKYVAALKSLERAGEQGWAKDKKAQMGNRFCEEKRRSAANSFKDFKKAADETNKRNHLKRTAAELDSCLFYFPDLSVAQKVRKNREMVEGELKKLKP